MKEYLPLIDCPDALTHFTKQDYPVCFKNYMADCAPLFAALRAGQSPAKLADSLLNAVEARILASRSRRGRQNAENKYRSIIALYLSPAALEDGSPECTAFAEELCRLWNARFSSVYELGTYSQLMEGFRKTYFFGIRI